MNIGYPYIFEWNHKISLDDVLQKKLSTFREGCWRDDSLHIQIDHRSFIYPYLYLYLYLHIYTYIYMYTQIYHDLSTIYPILNYSELLTVSLFWESAGWIRFSLPGRIILENPWKTHGFPWEPMANIFASENMTTTAIALENLLGLIYIYISMKHHETL